MRHLGFAGICLKSRLRHEREGAHSLYARLRSYRAFANGIAIASQLH
ncbi:hypothetical protein L284_01440 [Novosphingobium lindaniclasticum LE124]|uniref:Uncharacterized protein n=1 Tax=Novosphingobium lindaniclasticum LE124 TaxID=1096930 RepID=T0J5R4_9SPHN|nr:hypothetical protein L284_01440 [Novosphingobium lindaniclasticum LE124]